MACGSPFNIPSSLRRGLLSTLDGLMQRLDPTEPSPAERCGPGDGLHYPLPAEYPDTESPTRSASDPLPAPQPATRASPRTGDGRRRTWPQQIRPTGRWLWSRAPAAAQAPRVASPPVRRNTWHFGRCDGSCSKSNTRRPAPAHAAAGAFGHGMLKGVSGALSSWRTRDDLRSEPEGDTLPGQQQPRVITQPLPLPPPSRSCHSGGVAGHGGAGLAQGGGRRRGRSRAQPTIAPHDNKRVLLWV